MDKKSMLAVVVAVALVVTSSVALADPQPSANATIEDDTEDSYSCEGQFDSSHPCSFAVDEDWDTYALPSDPESFSDIYENFTIPSDVISATWTGKYGDSRPVTPGLPYTCTSYWNGSDWILFCGGESGFDVTTTAEIPDEALADGVLQVRTQVWKGAAMPGSGDTNYYEGKVTWHVLSQVTEGVPVSGLLETVLLGAGLLWVYQFCGKKKKLGTRRKN